jgi:hypothetical protein
MRKDIFLLIVGSCVFLTPFLGVPESWKAMILFVLGACVVIVALQYRLATRKKERNESEVYYEENEPHAKEEIIEV